MTPEGAASGPHCCRFRCYLPLAQVGCCSPDVLPLPERTNTKTTKCLPCLCHFPFLIFPCRRWAAARPTCCLRWPPWWRASGAAQSSSYPSRTVPACRSATSTTLWSSRWVLGRRRMTASRLGTGCSGGWLESRPGQSRAFASFRHPPQLAPCCAAHTQCCHHSVLPGPGPMPAGSVSYRPTATCWIPAAPRCMSCSTANSPFLPTHPSVPQGHRLRVAVQRYCQALDLQTWTSCILHHLPSSPPSSPGPTAKRGGATLLPRAGPPNPNMDMLHFTPLAVLPTPP